MPSNTTYNPTHSNQFEKTMLHKNATSIQQTISGGETTNIDILITDDCLLSAGESHMLVDGAAKGDKWSMQVVHPELGVVFEPVTDWYINWTNAKQTPPKSTFPAKILAGLTLRIVYTSVGESDVWVAINIDKDKVLV